MSEVDVHFHAEWEARVVLNMLNAAGRGAITGANRAECNHIANHVARAIDVDRWRNMVNDPEA